MALVFELPLRTTEISQAHLASRQRAQAITQDGQVPTENRPQPTTCRQVFAGASLSLIDAEMPHSHLHHSLANHLKLAT